MLVQLQMACHCEWSMGFVVVYLVLLCTFASTESSRKMINKRLGPAHAAELRTNLFAAPIYYSTYRSTSIQNYFTLKLVCCVLDANE